MVRSEVIAKRASVKRKAAAARPAVLPAYANAVTGTSLLTYVDAYFKGKVRAPFLSPSARDYYFVSEESFEVRPDSNRRGDVVAAISDFLSDFAFYLSNFLTHPRYGPERQVGFVRGESLRPYGLKQIGPGRLAFRVQGVAVGRKDLFRFLHGKNRAGPPAPPAPDPPYLSERIFFVMPTRPNARGVDPTEWYDFQPDKWKRKHPTIPLRPPIGVLFHRSRPHLPLSPRYEDLYRDGVIKIALLFGFDESSHLTGRDAREIWTILTAPRSKRFGRRQTGPHGYGGPGLGFADPTDGHFRQLNLEGESVFRRDAAHGNGPVRVRYRLTTALSLANNPQLRGRIRVGGRPAPPTAVLAPGTLVEQLVDAEIRLFDFDKAAKGISSRGLIRQFLSVFKDSDAVHYDGHANYGGGFFIGDRPNDILWSTEIGKYRRLFSQDYQVFSIGACHAAGYFADLFYNELRPRKSPRNLDILAAINETDFDDSVHQSLDFVRAMFQDLPARGDMVPSYERIIADMSSRNAFQAFIGVFGSGIQVRGRGRTQALRRQPRG